MLEVGCDLDLRQKPLGPDNRSQIRLQDLEGHLPVVLEVIGQVDRGHAALTELTLDGVAAFEGCVQASDWIGHGGQKASNGRRTARVVSCRLSCRLNPADYEI